MTENTGTDQTTRFAAKAACESGIAGYVHWRADTMDGLDAAITADETYVLPHLVKGWILHGVRDVSNNDTINTLVASAENHLSPGERRETTLLDALKLTRRGHGVEAATLLETLLDHDPTDLLAHRLMQFELFWTGRSAWMRDVTEQAAPAWSDDSSGYGPFLSMRAFANEEAGHLEMAERFGQMAIERDPTDVWGAHAVAHALIMRGDVNSGISWLENLCGHWGHANQMRHHLWWHLCLFLLEKREHDRALELLFKEVRNPASPLVSAAPAATIDIQNYASLLMRLDIAGANVGPHWETLADICANRVHNNANAFTNTHDMMVLAATGRFDQANTLLANIKDYANSNSGSLALAYLAAGIPACEAILAHRQGNYQKVCDSLAPARHDLPLLGASHAQRDVFFQLLIDAARRLNRADLCQIFLRDVQRIGFYQVSERAAYQTADEMSRTTA